MRIRHTAFLLAVLMASASSVVAQQDPEKVFKREASFHLKQMGRFIKEAATQAADAAEEFGTGVRKNLANVEDASDVIVGIANDAAAAVAAAVSSETQIVEQFTSGAIPANGAIPRDLQAGACGAIEKYVAKAAKAQLKAHLATIKAIKKLIKFLEKFTPFRFNFHIAVPDPPDPPVPAPVQPPQPKPKKTKINASAAGSDSRVNNDGKICVGGVADDDANINGGMVRVRIRNAANQIVDTQNIPVNNECKWRACFPATGSGNLPEGQYTIIVDRGANTDAVSESITIPGAAG